MDTGHPNRPFSAHLWWVLHTAQAKQDLPHVNLRFQREHVRLREIDELAEIHPEGAGGSNFGLRIQSHVSSSTGD
jgi:hypothetical protein